MTVCANRTDNPGFFTSCARACDSNRCSCGIEVRAEIEAAEVGLTEGDPTS